MMETEKRRSPRFAICLPLLAEWHIGSGGPTQRHDVVTESISAHGALVRVFTSACPDKQLVLKNPSNGQQAKAFIIAMEAAPDRNSFMLRVAFAKPVYEFWQNDHALKLNNKRSKNLISPELCSSGRSH